MSLGIRIKQLRIEFGVSRHELSTALNISYSTLSGYENDLRFPDQNALINIANYFDTTIDYLFERHEHKNIDFSNSSNYIDISSLESNEIQIIRDLIEVFQNR